MLHQLCTMLRILINVVFLFAVFFQVSAQPVYPVRVLTANDSIQVGAERESDYLPLLAGKNIAIVANQTSTSHGSHLVDRLLSLGIKVVKVFAPEHGFRGDAGAGEHIESGKDPITGLPLISLYGDHKKPLTSDLVNVDVIIFDIQDVGARFYTYLSTMHYVMEAAAEQKKLFIVLDRPNPNGFYVDGPVLNKEFTSFVGMHPIPVVHGCTLGELAQMINGEGWLNNAVKCDLKVIKCGNYTHSDLYNLPVKPSPNLPDMPAIYLYPSLCFFEGTIVSVGRGTEHPFSCIGYPGNATGSFKFTPIDIPGVAVNPPHEGKECSGHDLRAFGEFYFTASRHLYLEWLVGLYESCADKEQFFTSPGFFDKLAGTDQLRKQLLGGATASEIQASWEPQLTIYKAMRAKYLLYQDFAQ